MNGLVQTGSPSSYVSLRPAMTVVHVPLPTPHPPRNVRLRKARTHTRIGIRT
jgi:hypothetical protein